MEGGGEIATRRWEELGDAAIENVDARTRRQRWGAVKFARGGGSLSLSKGPKRQSSWRCG
jgi:hypothetical protein